MADGRGGYQKPSNPAPTSGPGKFSKRTDGAPKAPDIDGQDLQYGDRQMLEEGQKIAAPRGAAGANTRRMTGSPPVRGARIPGFLLNSPDTAPDEPTTAGLDMGPGPGHEVLSASAPAPDQIEEVLEFLTETYGDENARAMLAQHRAERAASMPTAMPAAPIAGGGLPPEEAEKPSPSSAVPS